ncbi:hypothetical protein CSAL01_09196 [Colletotrichum salicis]|uniref:Uncharacterized protein n=1 Tax=Colletotrichum salicis TaxID=1209931 RepID=A0A135V8C1_9PEZI|nr:hypothetical protein CSAL01_09196 [Colletotrichum salicis]
MCSEEVLLSACIGLIVVVSGGSMSSSKRTVRLAYATAAEYLLAQETIRDEQAIFLETSLNCLYHAPSQKASFSEEELEEHCNMYSLFRYAAAYKLAWDFASDQCKLGNALRTMTDLSVSHQTSVSAGHMSAYFGLENLVKRAMSKIGYVGFNDRTKSGDTPLHWAIAHNQQDFALFLLNEGADINIQNTNGKTALHMATAMDHRYFTKILIENKADLELQDSEGYTCLRWAARYEHQRTVNTLLEAGAKVSASDKDGYTALRWAAREGYKLIVKTLIDRGSSIQSPGSEEWTLLSWAAQEGQDYIISLLAKRGVNLDVSDSEGLTALSWAVKYNHEMTVWQLIKGGADVNKPEIKGNQPLHLAVDNTSGHHDKSSLNILWILLQNRAEAVIGQHLECCQVLIQKAEHLVNTKDLSWRTPLNEAVSTVYLPIVEMLLRHDAQIDAQTRKGQTPLYLSILQDHPIVAEFLVKKGANLQILNTNKRWTALHLAALIGSLDIVEMLINHGADVNAQDRQVYTALYFALQEGHGGIADCLKTNRAITQQLNSEAVMAKGFSAQSGEQSFKATDKPFTFEEANSVGPTETEEMPWWKGHKRFAATVEDE